MLGCLCRRLFYLLADIVIDDTRLQHIEHLHLIISFKEFEETAFKLIHLVQRHILQQTVRAAIKVAIVAFSSNSSLCGAFNSNVAKMLERTLEDYRSLGKENILVYPVGKKVEEAVKKLGYEPQGSYQEMADKPSYVQAYELAGLLMKEFLEGRVDKVELIYHHFKSMGSQVLTRDNYLPIDLGKVAEEATGTVGKSSFNNDYIVEPSASQLVAELLPKVLSQKIYTVLLDSNTSEHAARMLAMQAATDNANELIQDLTKQYNKSRQQAITNELLDIIGGSMK